MSMEFASDSVVIYKPAMSSATYCQHSNTVRIRNFNGIRNAKYECPFMNFLQRPVVFRSSMQFITNCESQHAQFPHLQIYIFFSCCRFVNAHISTLYAFNKYR